MLDDWYYNGQAWRIGLKALGPAVLKQPLSLSVPPLRGVRLIPVYKLIVSP